MNSADDFTNSHAIISNFIPCFIYWNDAYTQMRESKTERQYQNMKHNDYNTIASKPTDNECIVKQEVSHNDSIAGRWIILALLTLLALYAMGQFIIGVDWMHMFNTIIHMLFEVIIPIGITSVISTSIIIVLSALSYAVRRMTIPRLIHMFALIIMYSLIALIGIMLLNAIRTTYASDAFCASVFLTSIFAGIFGLIIVGMYMIDANTWQAPEYLKNHPILANLHPSTVYWNDYYQRKPKELKSAIANAEKN